jgi:hypothetical protein
VCVLMGYIHSLRFNVYVYVCVFGMCHDANVGNRECGVQKCGDEV